MSGFGSSSDEEDEEGDGDDDDVTSEVSVGSLASPAEFSSAAL
jgi:SIT4-associating protein SAP185/190